ncbi:hypothetical protein [Corallococcus exercitus]|uniref:hypothetical protein n=1 Tax=Corallococcus exercitus TaxID=2316736 RepID=UPI001FC971D7|nr:hypothetical protein [Corallococcus exercitus]
MSVPAARIRACARMSMSKDFCGSSRPTAMTTGFWNTGSAHAGRGASAAARIRSASTKLGMTSSRSRSTFTSSANAFAES